VPSRLPCLILSHRRRGKLSEFEQPRLTNELNNLTENGLVLRKILGFVNRGLEKQVPATGLGIFRICFGLVIVQEIAFLYYFRHLIFDPLPFIDQASPVVLSSLFLWGLAACCLVAGYRTRLAAVVNYLFWVIFVFFTPLRQDFGGGFDQLMTGSSFLLMFLPTEKALSLDNLRSKLNRVLDGKHFVEPRRVPVLCYYLPIVFSLGLLYFDAAVHKLSSEFWRNGFGAWLPSSMPYYMSGLRMDWLLNNKPVERLIGYTLIVFQFVFIFLCCLRPCRVPLLIIGMAFHGGILLCLNIYPFGFGMLAHYVLMVPFVWWRWLRHQVQFKHPSLVVFYDELCPLCNRTVIFLRHFDCLKTLEFKGLQTHARQCSALDRIPDEELLKDLYALDRTGRLYSGFDTYIKILISMKVTGPVGFLLKTPGVYTLGTHIYRKIADQRARLTCGNDCPVSGEPGAVDRDLFESLSRRCLGTAGQRPYRIAKFLVLILLLQLNSTVHYGLFYRLDIPIQPAGLWSQLNAASNGILTLSHTFLGITPHALYMHDHFAGYDHILAISYRHPDGTEKWLPFVNEQGRLLAPHWGRVQSMWANVAVTAHIKRERLDKFIRKVTVFWAMKLGLDLSFTEFIIKLKEIRAPMTWELDLRRKNMNQPWRDIGTAIWQNGAMRIEIPAIDLERL
jgi:predicted DCC family thiol-disulfide oxidoreductase YuxK/uncharacterized membrane protein YphA (DoxX/SURF4 family)